MFKRILSTIGTCLLLGGSLFAQGQFYGGGGVRIVGAFAVNDCAKILSRSSIGSTGAACGAGGGDALVANPLSQFAATTSAQLRGVLSDEAGTGAAYFVGGALGTPASGTATNITGLPEGGLSLTDITTNDVSTTKHGFAPKLPNNAAVYLDGTGAYSSPAGGKGHFDAWCTGTSGTANATGYALMPASISTGCAGLSSQSVSGPPIPFACTAKNLYVVVGTAGGAAGSGQFILRKNGTNQTITCTTGTGTSCNDTTHTVSFVAGDTWSMAFVTGQASDPMANPRISFECD